MSYNEFVSKLNSSDLCVTITRVFVSNGVEVNVGDLILEYETSKSNFELLAKEKGVLNLFVKEGDVVDVGSLLFEVGQHENTKASDKPQTEILEFPGSKKALDFLIEKDFNTMEFVSKYPHISFFTLDSVIELISETSRVFEFEPSDVVIWGGGRHSLQCLEILENDSKYKFVGFVDNEGGIRETRNQIIGKTKEDLFDFRKGGLQNVVVGFSGLYNLSKRLEAIYELKKMGFRVLNLISAKATISTRTAIVEDSGIQIFSNAYVGPSVTLGVGSTINTGAIVSHHCSIGEGCHVAPGAKLAGGCVLGKASLIGMGAAIYMDVNIPEKAIVQNNDVVNFK